MLGLIIFISTLVFVPHSFLVLGPIYYLFTKDRNKLINYKSQPININLLLIGLIVLLSFMNILMGSDSLSSFSQLFPYTALMFLGYFYAQTIQKSDLKILIYLILFESFVVILQHFMGISTFFPQLIKEVVQPSDVDTSLLYYNRAYGLSANSSVAALKFFLGFLIIDYLKLKGKLYLVIKILLLIGLYFTFNRTVLVVLFIYMIARISIPVLDVLVDLLDLKIKKKRFLITVLGSMAFVLILLLAIDNLDNIVTQFTRNKGLDLSGRDLIWADFISFIKENPLFGNHSLKYYFTEHYSGPIHAHNSFLQVMANHGIIISILFFLLIVLNLTWRNVLFVFALILYSLFQYGIFWGVSITDIILFIILFRKQEEFDISQRKIPVKDD